MGSSMRFRKCLVRHWSRLPREMMESPSPEVFQRMQCKGIWLSGEHGGAGLTLGLDELRGVLQPQ